MKRAILIILDGWGIAKESATNAIFKANTPNFDHLWKEYSSKKIRADNKYVGLPEDSLPGSEVGHLTIGAGKIVESDHLKIEKTIKKGKLLEQKAIKDTYNYVLENNSTLHLMGLCSDSTIHGSIDHLYAFLEEAKKFAIKKVSIHLFLDGRDVPSRSAPKYVSEVIDKCKQLGIGQVSSIIGRYYAMDRDKNMERTEKAVNLLIGKEGELSTDLIQTIKDKYESTDIKDYFFPAIKKEGGFFIQEGDAVISYNYRSDRVRQITELLNKKLRVKFLCMTKYKEDWTYPVAFEKENVSGTLGERISKLGLKQLRIAETEKYAHVTYFFNGEREEPYKGEDRILIDSDHLKSFAEKPEMQAEKIANALIKDLQEKKHHFYVVNFANADLVGHSGDLEASIKACEAVDQALGHILEEINKEDLLIITADHGNAERMAYKSGETCPSHSSNPVPLITNKDIDLSKVEGLADIASLVIKHLS